MIATVLAIPCGIWGARVVARQDKRAGVAMASAAATARGCKLGTAAITRMVGAYREQGTIGWAESGSAVAKNLAGSCHPQSTTAHSRS